MSRHRTKADALAAAFQEAIRTGAWSAGTKLPTERQLAADHGLSRATVRQAIRRLEGLGLVASVQGSGTYVAESAREEESCRAVSLLLPDTVNLRNAFVRTTFYPELLAGITDALAVHAARLLVVPFHREEWEAAALRPESLSEQFGQGVILAHSGLPADDLSLVRSTGLPVVSVGRPLGQTPVSFVDADHADGIAQCVRHLLAQGRERIVLWSGAGGTRHAETRVNAFRKALADAGNAVPPELIIQSSSEREETAAAAFNRVCSERLASGAILMAGENVLSAIDTIRAAGLTIPDDMALVAYGTSPFDDMLDCPLAILDVPSYRLGQEAADMIVEQVTGGSTIVRERLLQAHLLVHNGRSTATGRSNP